GWSSDHIIQYVDVNGDSKSDMVMLWNSAGHTFAYVCPSNGISFPVASWGAEIGGTSCGWDPNNIFYYFGNIAGNGKLDIVVFWNNASTNESRVCPADGG